MKVFSRFAIVAAALLGSTAALSLSRDGAAELSDITWEASAPHEHGGPPEVQIRFEGGNSSVSLETGKSTFTHVRNALGARGADHVEFIIDRAPGVLTCRGKLSQPYEGRGSCRFAPNASFVNNLHSRGLASVAQDELLTMALVGADLALIDGLTQQGLGPLSAHDIIATAALDVTPQYVASLLSAGLQLNSVEDAIACRALGVDEAYVRGIVAAGYQPSASDLIAMKATGATPQFAAEIRQAAQK